MPRNTPRFAIPRLIVLILISSVAFGETQRQTEERLKREIIHEIFQSEEFKQRIAAEIAGQERIKVLRSQDEQRQRMDAEKQRIRQVLRRIVPGRDRIYGHSEAPVSMVEFSDFECPYCRKVHPILRSFVNDSNGQVRWVLRHFPLASHQPLAGREAEAAECAGEQKGDAGFFRFAELLFQQPRRGREDPEPRIDRVAALAGLDRAALSACLTNGRQRPKVQADVAEATALNLPGTPALILMQEKTERLIIRQGTVTKDSLQRDLAELTGQAR